MLTGVIPIITKIELISDMITKYAPFSKEYINVTMFIIFVIVLIGAIINWIQYLLIRDKLYEIKSPSFINSFFKILPDKTSFTEHDVYSYISGTHKKFKRILSLLGVKVVKAETLCHLKDVFIFNMIQMQLADISYAEELNRRFKIKSKPKYLCDDW